VKDQADWTVDRLTAPIKRRMTSDELRVRIQES
jgi:hypothetical protein